VQLHRQ